MRRPGKQSTLTMTAPADRGTVLRIDSGRNAESVKVRRCVGAGPYTVTVRKVTWLDRAWWRITAWLGWPRRLVREWWLHRCDRRWCLRGYSVVDGEYDGWCWRHADTALAAWLVDGSADEEG